MPVSTWLSWPLSGSHARRATRRNLASRHRTARLFLEQLESRVTPSVGLSTLALFNGANGANSGAGLIMDGSGNLYGTTENGGTNGDGTAFEVAKDSGTLTTLASFNGTDGARPHAALIMDSSGNLYGTTAGGGASGLGTVFELAHGSGTLTALASFNGNNGQYPEAALVMDSSGNLYGTAELGGANGDGTVFELARGSGTLTTLASFNGTDGADPETALIMDSSGNLYGSTFDGGPTWNPGAGVNAYGSMFELAQGSGTITTLASFNGTNGWGEDSPLIMDSSGNLYGTTESGGAYENGNVFKLAKGTHTIANLASFNGGNGSVPEGGLTMDSSGNLYGTTLAGGASGLGTVFELAHGSGTLTALASFNASDGVYPESGLIIDSSGNFYGTTLEGADGTQDVRDGDGTIFELLPHTPALNWITPAAITYGTALSSTQLNASAADSVTGAAVAGTFVYTPPAGTILQGGFQSLSVTFTPTATTDCSPITTSVALFVDPATPVLTWNPAPIPYGTPLSSTQLDATATNPNNRSAVSGTFAYTPPAGTILPRGSNILNVTFTPADTTDYTTAKASVTLAVTPSYSVYDLAFNGNNGAHPLAGLLMDSSGNLYGTTSSGGAKGDGTVFELAKGASTFTTLATFNGSDGSDPAGGLVMDASGNLYGTAELGGASSDGTVFELAKGSSMLTTLASFSGSNGRDPAGGLLIDISGNLYGTTEYGGTNGDGSVFELAKRSTTITTLTSFNGTNGYIPVAGLIMDSSGNLYGTTSEGGLDFVSPPPTQPSSWDGSGTIFELPKGSGYIDTLASFYRTGAYNPVAGLTMDSSGNLYGTTANGGDSGHGLVFEMGFPKKSGHGAGSRTLAALASFNGTNGQYPESALIMDSSGNLYGTTEYGGANGDGTVFEVGAGSGLITTMVSFGGSDGALPVAGLLMDSSGNFYGTTTGGGASGLGTVFELPGAATSRSTANFIKSDTTTQGNWINTYGTVGYNVINSGSSYPASLTVTPSNELSYTWTTSATAVQALEAAPGSGDSYRVAACWYSATSFTVDVDFTDGQMHDIELYLLDYNGGNARTEQIQFSNPATLTFLSTQAASNFSGGVYYNWVVSGNVLITFTRESGPNAILNGLFIDPGSSSSSTAIVAGRGESLDRGGRPVFTNLATLADVKAGSNVTLMGGVGFATASALTDNGTLQLITNVGADTTIGTFDDLSDDSTFIMGWRNIRIHHAGDTDDDVMLSL
jgi:uncharacterized repeat protein (TIGR03803 family)